jgi:hypothetical protein
MIGILGKIDAILHGYLLSNERDFGMTIPTLSETLFLFLDS